MITTCDSCLETFTYTIKDIFIENESYFVNCPVCGEEIEIDGDNLTISQKRAIEERNENTYEEDDEEFD